MKKLLAILSVFGLISVFTPPPANAVNYCMVPTAPGQQPDKVQCNTPLTNYVQCSEKNGDIYYCPQTTAYKPKSQKSSWIKDNAVIAIGVSAVFLVGMYWLFSTPPSQYNPGQVRLMEF
ncbi:MAG: hypothetical protein LBB23_03325 [Rickettsiales bacterium]|jgi:hypothetical protein|nr:hypothetical protein [Rickettsiales bacterium]